MTPRLSAAAAEVCGRRRRIRRRGCAGRARCRSRRACDSAARERARRRVYVGESAQECCTVYSSACLVVGRRCCAEHRTHANASAHVGMRMGRQGTDCGRLFCAKWRVVDNLTLRAESVIIESENLFFDYPFSRRAESVPPSENLFL
eukprot:5592116-Prymnesium_polylepis.1